MNTGENERAYDGRDGEEVEACATRRVVQLMATTFKAVIMALFDAYADCEIGRRHVDNFRKL